MSSFLYSVVVSQKKPDSSGVNTDLATDDAKKLFEVNIFFTIMIDGLYGQQCSIKKKVDWFYRENVGLLLQVGQLSVYA